MIFSYFASAAFLIMALFTILYAEARLEKMVLLGVYVGATYLVWNPEISTWTANLFGIGRGLDFIFLIACIAAANVMAHVIRAVRRHQRQITLLAREIALLNVK
jgi:hypothetical protein